MQQLAFPHFDFKTKSNENKRTIFDPIRKKFVVLTPEEWVRQHVLHVKRISQCHPWGGKGHDPRGKPQACGLGLSFLSNNLSKK